MEDVLAFARQHAHIIPVVKIDDVDRARLAADRLRQRVRRWRQTGRPCPGHRRRELS